MENIASFDDSAWDLALDYDCLLDDCASPNFSWLNHSSGINIDVSHTGSWSQEQECSEKECPKKRGRSVACSKPGTKACRERLRREKLNDSFMDLSSILEPGRPAKADKLAILTDAIRVLNQLRSEAKEYEEENKKLMGEIESLKVEKNELREEKLTLKVEKEKMEKQLKALAVPSSGLMPSYSAGYPAGPNKLALYPSYGMFPMWHYLPPSARDTSHDHKLRPPAA